MTPNIKINQLYVVNSKETLKQKVTPNVINYKSNFTQEEYSTLQSLKGNQDIVSKTADKDGGWVIMDKNYYQDEIVKEHLLSNVYKEVFVDLYIYLSYNSKMKTFL